LKLNSRIDLRGPLKVKRRKSKKKNNLKFNYKKKNRKKAVRTVLQFVVLAFVFFFFYQTLFYTKQYQEPDKSSWSNSEGFIALSYFGVSRSGSETLIAKSQLEKQLQVLKDQGYVTISQQDIIDFYEKGKPLPKRALFLIFEDGRNDSSIFAQPILEKLNYRATMSTYANKFNKREMKFLQPKDLLNMKETGYWEIGSNGYRLSYINIFDDDEKYYVAMDESEFDSLLPVEKYNHYLMDFLRDEHGVPIEERAQMEERIDKDYELMKEIYQSDLGYIPNVYLIMHANSLYNGMNQLVENKNDENIKELFKLHFNREGNSYNTQKMSLYNLSRVQPAPHWAVNHLIMQIRQDSGEDLEYIIGDEKLAEDWTMKSGVAEFTKNNIILTSPPNEEGMLLLKDSHKFQNYRVKLQMEGIPEGKKSIYLKYDESSGKYVKLTMENDQLSIIEKAGTTEKTIYQKLINDLKKKNSIKVDVIGNELAIWLNDQLLYNHISFDSSIKSGAFALSSEPIVLDSMQKYDDLYYKGAEIFDTRFTDIQITELDSSNEEGDILYSNMLQWYERVLSKVVEGFNAVIDWAIESF